MAGMGRAGSDFVLSKCPCPREQQLCKLTPCPGAGAPDCAIPRDGARLLMSWPGCCQPACFLWFIFPLLPATHFSFPFLSIVLLRLDMGKTQTQPFPPAQPIWYDLTPQIGGKNPPPGSFLQSSRASAWRWGHPSPSSSSQLILEGHDAPAGSGGCWLAAPMFHDRLEITRLAAAGKCVVDYHRRRQTPGTLMVLPAPPHPSTAGECGAGNVALVSSPKPCSLSEDKEGKHSELWLGMCSPSGIPWLELCIPLWHSALGSPSLLQSLLLFKAVSADPHPHVPPCRALPVLTQHRRSLLRALQPRVLWQPLHRAF